MHGESSPHGSRVRWGTVGENRDDRIYGFYSMADIGLGAAACAAVVSSSPRGSTSFVGNDAASSSSANPAGRRYQRTVGRGSRFLAWVACGVSWCCLPASKPLTLSAAAFMVRFYVPVVAGASPSPAVLSDWWAGGARHSPFVQ